MVCRFFLVCGPVFWGHGLNMARNAASIQGVVAHLFAFFPLSLLPVVQA